MGALDDQGKDDQDERGTSQIEHGYSMV